MFNRDNKKRAVKYRNSLKPQGRVPRSGISLQGKVYIPSRYFPVRCITVTAGHAGPIGGVSFIAGFSNFVASDMKMTGFEKGAAAMYGAVLGVEVHFNPLTGKNVVSGRYHDVARGISLHCVGIV